MSTSTSSPQQLKDEIKVAEAKAVNQTIVQLRSLTAGAVGGLCAVIVGHPFDLVKVRLQTAEKGIYSGAMDVVRKTIAREGLARVGHMQAAFFAPSMETDAAWLGVVCGCVCPACGCNSNV